MPAPSERLPEELMKTLMPAEQFAAWQRQQEASKEFWRTLNGPAQRPLGANADEWNLFVSENQNETAFLAVQIATAIEEAEARGSRYFHYDEEQCPGHVASRFDRKICGLCGAHIEARR